MKKQPEMEPERLRLRPFALSDAARVQTLAGHFAIADKILNIPHPYEEGRAEEWISTHTPKYASKEAVTFAVTLKSSGDVVGAVGLSVNKKVQRADLGYWIGKQYWNNGYQN